jgi:hypothetical protein
MQLDGIPVRQARMWTEIHQVKDHQHQIVSVTDSQEVLLSLLADEVEMLQEQNL